MLVNIYLDKMLRFVSMRSYIKRLDHDENSEFLHKK